VKGRAIWGEVVPWDKPWRTGANQATTLIVSDDITVEGEAPRRHLRHRHHPGKTSGP